MHVSAVDLVFALSWHCGFEIRAIPLRLLLRFKGALRDYGPYKGINPQKSGSSNQDLLVHKLFTDNDPSRRELGLLWPR